MCNSTTGFGLIDRTIDLFHDTRHLCTRFTVDGIKATFPCFLRGQTEFAGTGNGGRVCLFSQNETTILVMQNVQISFVKLYVIIATVRTCTVVIASKDTLITSTHHRL